MLASDQNRAQPTISSNDKLSVLEMYQSQSRNIRAKFEESRDGQRAVRERSNLIDALVTQLWREHRAAGGAEQLCVVGLGGYGRQSLFPYSDVDLLFVSEETLGEQAQRRIIPKVCQALWDLHLRVSPTTRTLEECGKLYRDNLEFNISLLDCRYICGDAGLFERLRNQVIPKLVSREAPELQQRLIDLTQARHNKYGHTIFHLEPNIKESPGGMRDYQVACWLALVSEMEKTGAWPSAENLLPSALRKEFNAAVDFLAALRCFLHYRQGRDLNGLTYELQAEAASAGISSAGGSVTPAEWMRSYFRHVRSIYRLTVFVEEMAPTRSGLYRLFENRKSRLSNADFSVVEGRVFLRQLASVEDPAVLFRLFQFVARHGLKLSAETERRVEGALPAVRSWAAETTDLWEYFRGILILPHTAAALRAMHTLGVLTLVFPEFRAIDSLVIRDYYHRYTVDEHSFVAIESLLGLRASDGDLDRRFRDIVEGIERPELLFLALLFHDVGKGMPAEDHIEGSLEAAEGVFQRLRLEPSDRETVTFLIANHLVMSATVMRRDIFDPKAVQDFGESVGTTERLNLLTLLTYADIKAVNPEALTPWKSEILWQLYVAASNSLSRSVDDQRVNANLSNEEHVRRIAALSPDFDAGQISTFLEGFPRRYLLTHSPAEVVSHFRMNERMVNGSRIEIVKRNGYFEVTVLATDRPLLFARIAGTLSSWGMNILKAEAFANRAGTVLDTFRFADRFRTLDLNPTEVERLKRSLTGAVSGEIDVAELMRKQFKPGAASSKVKVGPRVHIDDDGPAHSTLVEITANDRPGLLYVIGSAFAELECNIEVAIIDTQGHTAIDVFYVTRGGTKLPSQDQSGVRAALLRQL